MNPVVEVDGRQYPIEGNAEVMLEPEEVVRVDDTPVNRSAIDRFRNDRAFFSGVKPLTVKPDEKGVVTFGVQKLPLPKGYQRDTRISQVKVLVKKAK